MGISNFFVAEQLTNNHNVRNETIIEKLKAFNVNDHEVVQLNNEGIWRIKAIIEVLFFL